MHKNRIKFNQHLLLVFPIISILLLLFAGCAGHDSTVLPDGEYEAEFETDGSMFHVNEACEGKGTLTVKDGEMNIHISLPSKSIVNLYPGLAKDAAKDGAVLLEPTIDTVTYNDGTTEEVHGFDVPVPVINEEFDLAIIGTKGKWYDHKVKVLNPIKKETSDNKGGAGAEPAHLIYDDGEYLAFVNLEGGTGKATLKSPAHLRIEEGRVVATLEWSSPYYDYMIVDNEKYYPVNTDGNSIFDIPIVSLGEPMTVVADTTAMGSPHEIEYTLTVIMDENTEGTTAVQDETSSGNINTIAIKNIAETLMLEYESTDKNEYAEGFLISRFKDGFILLQTSDGSNILIVPADEEAPENLPRDIIVLKQPVNRIYLAASAVMDMFLSAGATDNIRLSGIKAEDWHIEEARSAMESGKILYAGKYSTPDYEMVISEGTNLAIESSMIFHSPDVKEKLISLGVPVIVDLSSYETHPLGRTEWVKFYGALTDHKNEADKAFDRQKRMFETVSSDAVSDGKTVAFFYITTSKAVNVRRNDDYVPKMINLAGGKYIFADNEGMAGTASVNMQMEEFYASARDADYLIYNGTIDGEIDSVDELIKKSPLFSDFKAVIDGNVFCASADLYQKSMDTGTFTTDIHSMLTASDDEEESFVYITRLK